MGLGTCSAQSVGIFGSTNLGVNNTGAKGNVKAVFDISSPDKGLLIPRITSESRDTFTNVPTSLLFFNTTTNQYEYYNGATWSAVAAANTNWSLTGNAGTVDGTNFIGTTDDIPFNIKVNNQTAGRIEREDGVNFGGNTFYGWRAGNSNAVNVGLSEGLYNTATGNQSLYSNTSGVQNTASGYGALYSNTIGDFNTASGTYALFSNSTGNENTAFGSRSLYFSTSGSYNTALGNYALSSNKTGSNATAIGYNAMQYANNTVTPFTNYNVAVGYEALRGSVTPASNTGNNNTALGAQSLFGNTSGDYNTATGEGVLYNNTSGDYNTGIGNYALTSNTTGSNNTAIGYFANVGSGSLSNATAIGANAFVSASNSLVLGDGANVGIGTTAPLATLDITKDGGTVLFPRKSTAGDPGTPINGMIYYNSNLNKFRVYENGAWADMVIGAASPVWVRSAPNVYLNTLTDNVGIGLTTPAAKLDIHPDASYTGMFAQFQNDNNTNGNSILQVITNGSGNAINVSQTGFGLALNIDATNSSSSTTAAKISSSGNSSKSLEVLHVGTNGGSTDYGVFSTATGAGTNNIGGYFSASGATNNYSGIFDQGNVGIGTTSPSQKLELRDGNMLLSNGALAGELRFAEPGSTNYTAFKAQAQAADITYSLPTAISAGNFLTTDGGGNLTWSVVSGAPPTGAAGGDLTGNYPNPTINTGAVTTAKIFDGTIANIDVSGTAAIARSKIGPGTANWVVINDGIGNLSEVSTLARNKIGPGTANWVVINDGVGNLSETSTLARNKIGPGTANWIVVNDGIGNLSEASSLARNKIGPGTANWIVVNDGIGNLSEVSTLARSKIGPGTANWIVINDGIGNLSETSTLARNKITSGTINHVLINDGTGNLSSEAQLALSRGGTAANLTAVNGGAVYSTGTAMGITAVGTSGQVLTSNAAAAPTWQSLPSGASAWITSGSSINNNNTLYTNVAINTTGTAPAATNMFEVTNNSSSSNSTGIYSNHLGGVGAGTGYALQALKTGGSLTNIAGYFSASGGTNNYALIVPSGGGNVGIGTSSPSFGLDIKAFSNIQVYSINTATPALFVKNTNGGSAPGTNVGTNALVVQASSDGTETKYALQVGATGADGNKTTVDVLGSGAVGMVKGMNISTSGTGSGNYGVYSNATGAATNNVGGYFSASGATTGNYAGIFNLGNVGIGTTAPSQKLHIEGSAAELRALVKNTDATVTSAIAALRVESQQFNNAAQLETGEEQAKILATNALSISDFSIYPTAVMDLTNKITNFYGNVGVGSFTPAMKLSVFGSNPKTTTVAYENIMEVTSKDAASPFTMRFGIKTDVTPANRYGAIEVDDAGTKRNLSFQPTGGNVGIGTTSPGGKLHINAAVDALVIKDGALSEGIILDKNMVRSGWLATDLSVSGSNNLNLQTYSGGWQTRMSVLNDGRVIIGTCATPPVIGTARLYVAGAIRASTLITTTALACSDIRFKKEVAPLYNSLGKILKLQGVNYYWKKDEFPDWMFTEGKQIGFIAQEVEKIFPELVHADEDSLKYKSVDYSKLTPVLVEAIKEQQQIIDSLSSAMRSQQLLIQKIETRNIKLESELSLQKKEIIKIKEYLELKTKK